MVTSLTEGLHAGEHIVYEVPDLARDNVTITGGADLGPATVLGQITIGTESSAAGTNTGNGVLGAVTLAAGALPGAYKLKITKAAANAGDFEVIDPNNEVCGVGTVGVAFVGGGLSFTLADGASDFVVGDTFTLTVGAGSGKLVQLAPSAADGSQIAAGVLWGHAKASAGDVASTVNVRLTAVNGPLLVWPGGISGPQKAAAIAQLAARNIILRS